MQVQLGLLRYSKETSAVKDDGYLEPKDLDETVSELHFSALGSGAHRPYSGYTAVKVEDTSKGEHYRY